MAWRSAHSRHGPRLAFVAAIAFYCLAYVASYEWYIAPRYAYWGCSHIDRPPEHLLLVFVLAVVPSLWLPVTITRPSQFLFLVQYLIIYIPSLHMVFHASKPMLSYGEAVQLAVLMFMGMSIIQSMYYIGLGRIRPIHVKVSSKLVRDILIVLVLFLAAYVVVLLGSNFRLANLEEIYTVRETARDRIMDSGTRLGSYARMWLAGFFLPFAFALGAFGRKVWLIALTVAAYIFLFGVGGTKTTLFAAVFLSLVYLWVRNINGYSQALAALGLALLLHVPVLLSWLRLEGVEYWYVGVLNFRTFAVPALCLPQYFEFFEHNPLTYMSHVTGINLVVDYPYQTATYLLVGEYFYNRGLVANAGFWAGDGITAFGPIGIPLVSFACAGLFWLVDSIARRLDVRFVVVAVTFIAVNFANASLFTTLVSGGLGLLLLTFLTLRNEGTFSAAFTCGAGVGMNRRFATFHVLPVRRLVAARRGRRVAHPGLLPRINYE